MKYGSAYGILQWDLSCSLSINHYDQISCIVGEYKQESINADSILEQTFLDR